MSGIQTSGKWSLDEKSWWWVLLSPAVMAAATWGILGLVEGGCVRGPRGGCVAAEGYELRSWTLFLAAIPTLLVVVTGLCSVRLPPALGVALGGTVCGLYTLAQGRTLPHLVVAVILFVMAATAPVGNWYLRRRERRSPAR
ncbi:hypothetical protein [Streptomyces sp. NPDC015131]|uniref:hypothetical protein n=1 Tax=Streptomyces sp. NPDC015131 TaxID=3364941 RepID=UPI0036FF6186